MALTAEEREVTISFSDADNLATVYTASPKWMRKFDRLVLENPTEYAELTSRRQYAGTDVISKTYTMPIHLISIRTKAGNTPTNSGQSWRSV